MFCKQSNNLEEQRKEKSKQWPQYLAVFTASLCGYAVGFHYSWSSPSFPILLSDDYPVNITSEEASLVTIIYPLGDILGAPIAAVLADIIGRKNGILLIALPTFFSWMLIAFAENVTTLYIARFIGGIGDGFLFIVHPMYVGEVTDPKIRGALGCCLSLSMITGTISINAIAPFLSIRNTALVSSIVPILLVITFIWMPESPYFYLMKGQVEKAKKSLHFLRRCNIEHEFEQLKKDVERQTSERGTVRDLFIIDSNRKALFICLGIRAVQQFSGISAWNMFTQTIFTQAGGNMSPILSTLIYLFIQLAMTIFGSVLLVKFGRKPLLITSSIGTGAVLIIGGIYFYFKEVINIDTSSFSWIPLLVMICFVIMFSIGLGTVPSLMLSELFSASIKGKALCIMCICYAAMISITSKLFYYLLETFGMYASYFTFGISCLISVIFSYYFVPETKDKSLEEIQQHLKGNK